MQYRVLGSTGVEVSTQCLGTMMFGAMGNTDHDDCVRIIHKAIDEGINFIDTADVYSFGESETIVGKALEGRRDNVVLATKFFNPMDSDRNQRGGSRRWIMKEIDNSLRRLNTDYIDLYQIHRPDFTVDLDETLGALSDLVTAGKIRYLGSSTFPAEWMVEAQWAAERRNRERCICEQPQYSIFARSVEVAVLPTALRYNMGVIPWSPLSGGWLAGKYRKNVEIASGSRYSADGMLAKWSGRTIDISNDPRLDLVEELALVAEKANISLPALGLAFVNAHPAVTSAIIGPRTMEQLEDLISISDVTLDTATLDAIDKIVPPGTDAPRVEHYLPNPGLLPENRRRSPQ